MNDLVPAAPPRPRLLHYNRYPKLKRPLAVTVQTHPYGDMTGCKPRGLWISVEGEDDWRTWCLAENFRLIDLRYVWEVKFVPTARILWVRSVEEFDGFHRKYSAPGTAAEMLSAGLNPSDVLLRLQYSSRSLQRMIGIDWRRVSKDYQGIVISPYLWERRMSLECFWYYGWDCASGCIWDPQAIEMKLLPERGLDEKTIKRHIHSQTTKRRRKKIMQKARRFVEEERAARG